MKELFISNGYIHSKKHYFYLYNVALCDIQASRRKGATKRYKHLLCDIKLGRDNLASVPRHRESWQHCLHQSMTVRAVSITWKPSGRLRE